MSGGAIELSDTSGRCDTYLSPAESELYISNDVIRVVGSFYRRHESERGGVNLGKMYILVYFSTF